MARIEPSLPKWAVLMKFGMKEHLQEFREEGVLYTRPINYFASLEADKLRSDRFEGSDWIYQPKDITRITVKDGNTGKEIVITPADMDGPVVGSLGQKTHCNIFCMFAVTRPIPKDFVGRCNYDFGVSFTIVTNTQKFLTRVLAAASKSGLGCEYRPVSYFDASMHSGETGPFWKSSEFAQQQEFRFAFRPGSDEAFKLKVGSLVDITTPIHPLDQINELCDFGPESAKLAGSEDEADLS